MQLSMHADSLSNKAEEDGTLTIGLRPEVQGRKEGRHVIGIDQHN